MCWKKCNPAAEQQSSGILLQVNYRRSAQQQMLLTKHFLLQQWTWSCRADTEASSKLLGHNSLKVQR